MRQKQPNAPPRPLSDERIKAAKRRKPSRNALLKALENQLRSRTTANSARTPLEPTGLRNPKEGGEGQTNETKPRRLRPQPAKKRAQSTAKNRAPPAPKSATNACNAPAATSVRGAASTTTVSTDGATGTNSFASRKTTASRKSPRASKSLNAAVGTLVAAGSALNSAKNAVAAARSGSTQTSEPSASARKSAISRSPATLKPVLSSKSTSSKRSASNAQPRNASAARAALWASAVRLERRSAATSDVAKRRRASRI